MKPNCVTRVGCMTLSPTYKAFVLEFPNTESWEDINERLGRQHSLEDKLIKKGIGEHFCNIE